jgi:hypothetical protein
MLTGKVVLVDMSVLPISVFYFVIVILVGIVFGFT